MLRDIIRNIKIIYKLSKNDFKNRYLDSYLGIFWAILYPLLYLIVMWFVFQVGFRTLPVGQYPFTLWLATGLIPWFFFSAGWSNASYSILENKEVITHGLFNVRLFPVIKIFADLFLHLIFVIILCAFFYIRGYELSIYIIQIFYYLFAGFFLVLSLSLLTSSIMVFVKDLKHVINIFLQFGFWVTPVFWSLEFVPEKYHFFIKLNPVYYLIEGYRESFFSQAWFWEHPYRTMYFWLISVLLYLIGNCCFSRLRPHFADVL